MERRDFFATTSPRTPFASSAQPELIVSVLESQVEVRQNKKCTVSEILIHLPAEKEMNNSFFKFRMRKCKDSRSSDTDRSIRELSVDWLITLITCCVRSIDCFICWIEVARSPTFAVFCFHSFCAISCRFSASWFAQFALIFADVQAGGEESGEFADGSARTRVVSHSALCRIQSPGRSGESSFSRFSIEPIQI